MDRRERESVPSKLERWLLVLYKKYPSIEAQPNSIPIATIEKVRNKGRIHLSLLSMVFFSGALFWTARQGRVARQQGHSVEKMNIEWHRRYNDSENKDNALPDIRLDPTKPVN